MTIPLNSAAVSAAEKFRNGPGCAPLTLSHSSGSANRATVTAMRDSGATASAHAATVSRASSGSW